MLLEHVKKITLNRKGKCKLVRAYSYYCQMVSFTKAILKSIDYSLSSWMTYLPPSHKETYIILIIRYIQKLNGISISWIGMTSNALIYSVPLQSVTRAPMTYDTGPK